jgi:lipoprotein-releasing system ATP-binding protein
VSLVEVKALEKGYPTADGVLPVLRGVDFSVEPGETVAIVGESGSGKSTLLHLMGALDRPDSGSVLFNGEDVFAKSDPALAAFRNASIGFIFQFHHLLPEFTAEENVAMPALIRKVPMSQALARARELLERMGLAQRATHRPAELSGGEQQRIAVARALMNDPALVLADEPTGNLDERTGDALQAELLRLSRELGQAFVIVTHSSSFARQAGRVLRLENGVLQSQR